MKLTGGEIVAEYLRREKVSYVAGIPGHGCLGLVDAFRERKIKVIQVRQEMSGVHLADGYFRIKDKPLCVFTSIGPGAINTAIGVATCWVDSIPVLILAGDTHTYMEGVGVLQEIERTHDSNFPRILEPIVKRWWRPSSVRVLPRIMARAFNLMLSGRKGPVLIDLPMDIQADSAEVEIPEPEKRRPWGGIFPDPKEVEKAVDLLLEAKRPLILAGGGTLFSGAESELRELAEWLGVPVISTMQSKGVFPEDHPLYGWVAGSKGTTCGNKLARTCDVLLAIGCRFADETTSSYRKGISYTIPPTRVIQVDIDPQEIGKNYPVEVGIVGDAKETLRMLLELVKERKKKVDYKNSSYFKELQKLKREWFEFLSPYQNSKEIPMTISRMLKETRKALPPEAIVVYSSGNTQAQILQEFPFYEPRTSVTTGGFSTMGFTLPASLGAKLAFPERPVVGIVGDGDFMMTIQELATAVQYNIPVVILVANNSGWISIKDLQLAVFGEGRAVATDFTSSEGKVYSPDFVGIAKSFGCEAKRIERPEEIAPSLKEALSSEKPVVLEAIVNRKFPLSGVPATGWWDVPVPAYLKEKREKYEKERGEELI